MSSHSSLDFDEFDSHSKLREMTHFEFPVQFSLLADVSLDFDSSRQSTPSSSSSSSSNQLEESAAASSASSRSSRSAHSMSLRSAAMSPNGSGNSRLSGAASTPPTEHSDSSGTEDYDMPDLNGRDRDVIDLSSTQFMTQAPVDLDAEEDDDDVMLIPQHIETIDLCSENLFEMPRPYFPHLGSEVIEIEDSPASRRRETPEIVMRPPRTETRTSPYQASAAAKKKSLPKPRPMNLDDSQIDEPSQRVKITCPICLDSSMKKKLVSTKCGHIYCEDCLKLALQNLKKCPVCRKALTGRDPYHPIFFNGHM